MKTIFNATFLHVPLYLVFADGGFAIAIGHNALTLFFATLLRFIVLP